MAERNTGGFSAQTAPEALTQAQAQPAVELPQPVVDRAQDTINQFGEPNWMVKEMVTSGEVRTIIKIAHNVLDKDAHRSELPTGEEVTVTTHSIPHTTTQGEQVFLRLMRYKHPRRFGNQPMDHMYLVYDEDESPDRLRIDNPDFIKLDVGKDGSSSMGIYVEAGLLDLPKYNDPEMVEFVKRTIMQLVNKYEDLRDLTKEEKAAAIARRIEVANELWGSTRTVASDIARKPGELIDNATDWWRYKPQRDKDGIIIAGVTGALALVIIGGTAALVASADGEGPVTKFDKVEHVLEGGTELAIGETGNPEYSFDLRQAEALSPDAMPELNGEGDSASYGLTVLEGQTPDEQADIDDLRQVVINSSESKDGENSETVYVNLGNAEDTIKVWTDDMERADEFDVTLNDDSVTVTWNGQEIDKDDDPRIVIQRVPAEESESAPSSGN